MDLAARVKVPYENGKKKRRSKSISFLSEYAFSARHVYIFILFWPISPYSRSPPGAINAKLWLVFELRFKKRGGSFVLTEGFTYRNLLARTPRFHKRHKKASTKRRSRFPSIFHPIAAVHLAQNPSSFALYTHGFVDADPGLAKGVAVARYLLGPLNEADASKNLSIWRRWRIPSIQLPHTVVFSRQKMETTGLYKGSIIPWSCLLLRRDIFLSAIFIK